MYSPILALVLCGIGAWAQDAATAKAFRGEKIIPDILREPPPPRALSIVYPTKKSAQLGNTLKLIDVVNEPELKWPTNGDRRNQLYTVMLVDPDAKSRKTHELRSFLHWMVINVRGNHIHSGRTVATYIPPGPPKDTGLHRYVMLVFRQQRPISPRAIKCYKVDDRVKFDVVRFAQKHNLDRGQPLAGNFFQCERDASVPES